MGRDRETEIHVVRVRAADGGELVGSFRARIVLREQIIGNGLLLAGYVNASLVVRR
ncbi:hypothetical protein [Fodinicola feengrottensis]|uniref:hypothetical protein n=1 Tax=Fodinicola feengrottensis TaxID=435914 RepID=UPI002442CE80|nr:hypothetical protein [Fodinicola feengrottensis]